MSASYREAARILSKHWDRKKKGGNGSQGLKAMVLNPKVQNKGLTKAVVYETIKFKSALDQVLRKAKLNPSHLAKNTALLYVMLYDHLFGHGIRGGGAVKRAIMKHNDCLVAALESVRKENGAGENADLVSAELRAVETFPRYARVNLLKISPRHARHVLEAEGIRAEVDAHLPYLLKLEPNAPVYNHALVESGKLILQDKASCLPAEILCRALAGIESQFDVIDATAAPGNKTSQLAALLHEKQPDVKVFAFDKSPRRLDVLIQRMHQAGASRVSPLCVNFLTVDPAVPTYQHVRGILLDPSCSGSGMVTRLDHLMEETEMKNDSEQQNERLTKLADFQKKCLMHALSFPKVQFVTYSTCSVNKEENEAVIAEVLQHCTEFELCHVLPEWRGRGMRCCGLSGSQADCMIRADPKRDQTNGFFVALLRRKDRPQPQSSKKRKMVERRKRRRKKAKLRKRNRGEHTPPAESPNG